MQPDGRIVVVGADGAGAAANFVVLRYTEEGALDATFGTDGIVTTDFGGDFDGAYAVRLQPDGRILVAGYATVASTGDFAFARYLLDGTLDPTFGSEGTTTTDFAGSHDGVYTLALLADGRFVAAGGAGVHSAFSALALARYTPDGALDPTFGTEGRVTTSVGIASTAFDLALQPDGQLVAAGSSLPSGGNRDFLLARYLSAVPTAEEPSPAPSTLALSSHPNPVRGTATLRFALPEGATVRLTLYDALGREAARLVDGPRGAGVHEARLVAARLAPGVYVLRLDAGTQRLTRRLTVVR